MITNQYVFDFFEKKKHRPGVFVKTRYGKALGSKFVINEGKAREWLAQRPRFNSRVSGKP